MNEKKNLFYCIGEVNVLGKLMLHSNNARNVLTGINPEDKHCFVLVLTSRNIVAGVFFFCFFFLFCFVCLL